MSVLRVFAYDRVRSGINPIRFGFVCDSDSNPYIPMFAFFTGLMVKKGEKKLLIYSPFVDQKVSELRRTRSNLSGGNYIDHIVTGQHVRVRAYDQVYYTHKHCVYQVDTDFNVNFLFVLCLERDYFLSIKSQNVTLDKNKLLLIESEQIQNEEHKSFRLKFNKYKREHMQGIDTLFTSDINKYCFQNNLKSVKFKTVMERVNYLNNLKNNFNGKITK